MGDRDLKMAEAVDTPATCEVGECMEAATVIIGPAAEVHACPGHGAQTMMDLSEQESVREWFRQHPDQLRQLLSNLGLSRVEA